jgi:hypothetical protein
VTLTSIGCSSRVAASKSFTRDAAVVLSPSVGKPAGSSGPSAWKNTPPASAKPCADSSMTSMASRTTCLSPGFGNGSSMRSPERRLSQGQGAS